MQNHNVGTNVKLLPWGIVIISQTYNFEYKSLLRISQKIFYLVFEGSKNLLVCSYLRVPQAVGQVKISMFSNVN